MVVDPVSTSTRIARPRGCAGLAIVVFALALAAGPAPSSAQSEPGAVVVAASRAEALDQLADPDDWRARAAGLRALVPHLAPGDEPLLSAALADPHLAVVSAAADALAALGSDEAFALLAALLAERDAKRREAAALALMVRAEPTDLPADLERLARLQIVSEEGRRWLAARETWLATRALRTDHAADLEAIAALTRDPALASDCIAAEAAVLGIELEVLLDDPERAERFWREGRLDRLPDERIRLETAARIASALVTTAHARCSASAALEPVGDPLDPDRARVSPPGLEPSDPLGMAIGHGSVVRDLELLLSVEGFVGYDNHTFLLNPALRASEPGPLQGVPLDRQRDDVFGGGRDRLGLLVPHDDNSLALGYGVHVPPELRTDVLYLELSGGYEGRLHWEQLMGPDAWLRVLYDRSAPASPEALQHWRAELEGGLETPHWADEHDLRLAPVQRAGGRGHLAWSDLAVAPVRQREGIDRLHLGLEAQGWAALSDTDAEQGIVPPEQWWSELSGAFVWHFASLTPERTTWLGLSAELATRFSEGSYGHGAGARAALRVSHVFDDAALWFDLGYGVALPFGSAAAQTDTGALAVDLERKVEHAPVARGHLRYRLLPGYDDELQLELALDLEHRLALAGRYGWSAVQDRGRFAFDTYGPFGLHYSRLALFVERAHYPRGAVRDEPRDRDDHSSGDVEMVVAGFELKFPFYLEPWFFIGLQTEGRLASDSARFDGRLEGQFRVQALTTLSLDLLASDPMKPTSFNVLYPPDDHDFEP